MNLVTLVAFEDELAAIQKEAGVRDALRKGTKPLVEQLTHAGQKAGVLGEGALDKLRKAPVVGKNLKKLNLGHIHDMANRLLI